ncbi:hypothetical protein KBD45_04715 [Candidatus Dojkabacteria bacterium]|nr:hypothetical protein [Candidatus Dojkabacteria bacterium]
MTEFRAIRPSDLTNPEIGLLKAGDSIHMSQGLVDYHLRLGLLHACCENNVGIIIGPTKTIREDQRIGRKVNLDDQRNGFQTAIQIPEVVATTDWLVDSFMGNSFPHLNAPSRNRPPKITSPSSFDAAAPYVFAQEYWGGNGSKTVTLGDLATKILGEEYIRAKEDKIREDLINSSEHAQKWMGEPDHLRALKAATLTWIIGLRVAPAISIMASIIGDDSDKAIKASGLWQKHIDRALIPSNTENPDFDCCISMNGKEPLRYTLPFSIGVSNTVRDASVEQNALYWWLANQADDNDIELLLGKGDHTRKLAALRAVFQRNDIRRISSIAKEVGVSSSLISKRIKDIQELLATTRRIYSIKAQVLKSPKPNADYKQPYKIPALVPIIRKRLHG